MSDSQMQEPVLELINRYFIGEDHINMIYDSEGDRIPGDPTDVPGTWEVFARALIPIERGEAWDHPEGLPINLAHIHLTYIALKEAMAQLEPPVMLREDDNRIEFYSSYVDGWNPGLASHAIVDRTLVVEAVYKQDFSKNQEVPKVTEGSQLPALDIDFEF